MENMKSQKYLELLSQIYPNVQSVATEIINLEAILYSIVTIVSNTV